MSEELNELSKKSLSSYVSKAKERKNDLDDDYESNHKTMKKPYLNDLVRKSDNKYTGLKRAERKLKEDEEYLDEISKKTLGSYIKGASHDVATNSAWVGHHSERARRYTDNKSTDYTEYKDNRTRADKLFNKSWSRRRGIEKAVNKLTKEDTDLVGLAAQKKPLEFEQAFTDKVIDRIRHLVDAQRVDFTNRFFQKEELLDELSKKTLQSYRGKSFDDAAKLKSQGDYKKAGKRFKGQDNAFKAILGRKYTKENEELLDELSKKTLKSYQKKATTSRDRSWAKADKEEDKSMSTDGNKYPEKQKRHADNAGKAVGTWRKREDGLKKVAAKLKK